MTSFDARPLPGRTVATVQQVRDWQRVVKPSGVVKDALNELVLTNTSGLDWQVDTGQVHVEGIFGRLETAATGTAATADATDDRIDRVVARLDPTANGGNGDITVAYKAGTPAADPVAPALVQNVTGVWEIPLYRFTVAAAAGVLSAITDERVLIDPTGSDDSVAAKLGTDNLLHVRDEKAAGTAGGTFTSGAWRTRDLNTVKTNTIAGASLATNQVTLPAGEYLLLFFAPAEAVGLHKAKLRDTTGSADLAIGSSELTTSAASIVTASRVMGSFTLISESVLELQHRCTTTRETSGFGQATSYGVVEVYSELMIWKVG